MLTKLGLALLLFVWDVASFWLCFLAVALPQARKASIARFLEKRKERYTQQFFIDETN